MQVASRGVRSNIPKFFRGGLAIVEEVRAQYPLPETADELCAVAQSSGAGEDTVYLGEGERIDNQGAFRRWNLGASPGRALRHARPALWRD